MAMQERVFAATAANTGPVLDDELLQATQPVVLRGLVAHWPLVRAAQQSDAAALDYLRRFDNQATVGAWMGPPEIEGRFFYNDAFDGFNYQAGFTQLADVMARLQAHRDDPRPPALYVGSTTLDACLPGLRAENDLALGARDPLVSIWLGNRACVAAHYDVPDNIACVAAGRRRFTLFPPEQLANLYIGPLDFNPAGQAISLVDFAKPDLERFPRFSEAMRHAQVAELGPGDAIFIPSMWWHHVQALEPVNVLVNYWWRQSPDFMDVPTQALMMALLSMRGLPAEQRKAWQQIFQHYVFDSDGTEAAHIPEAARGVLAPLGLREARQLRGHILNRFNR